MLCTCILLRSYQMNVDIVKAKKIIQGHRVGDYNHQEFRVKFIKNWWTGVGGDVENIFTSMI